MAEETTEQDKTALPMNRRPKPVTQDCEFMLPPDERSPIRIPGVAAGYFFRNES